MKMIRDGKLYNTETAVLIHAWHNGYLPGDFKFRSKHLYKSPKGTYFLHHEGGPMTDMARSAGSNSWSGSEALEVLSREDAQAFLASHDGAEAYLQEFGAEEG